MSVQLEAQPLCEFNGAFRCLKSHGKDDEGQILLLHLSIRIDKVIIRSLILGCFRNRDTMDRTKRNTILCFALSRRRQNFPMSPNIHIEQGRLRSGDAL